MSATHTQSANIKKMVTLAMLAAITYVVMLLCKNIPAVSGFLQLEVKETIICIGGFIYGPLSAAVISIVVAVVEFFTVSDTGPIGLVMNLLATASFCCTASYIYKKMHSRRGAVIGLGVATLVLTAVMLLWNYLITPLYMVGVTREAVAKMLPTVFLPFNLVKGALNMAATLIIYKPVVTGLRKANLVPPSHDVHAAPKKLNIGFWLFALALLATAVVTALVLMGIIK